MSALVNDHIVHLRAAGMSAKTIEDRIRVLRSADQSMPYGIDTATTSELAAFLATPGWSQNTRRTYYSHIASFYRWACGGSDPILDWNPCDDLTKPKHPHGTPHPVTDEELARALTLTNGRWRLIITLSAYAGLRCGDICRLRREDVNARTITVWAGKGNRAATLPTHPEIWRLVEPRPPGRLVPLKGDHLSAYARGVFDKIGMPDVHLHRFRHWYATMLLRTGADIRTVQSLMRHSSLATTARYLEITDEQRRFAVSTLPIPSSHQQEAA